MLRRVCQVSVAAGALLCVAADVHAAAESARGARLFGQHCVQCHGARADGQGALASRFNPRPSNLVTSTRTEDYMAQIVTLGGRALGRSEVMPEWGLELSGQDILAIVEYVRSLSARSASGNGWSSK